MVDGDRRGLVEPWSLLLGFLIGVALTAAGAALLLDNTVQVLEEQMNVTFLVKTNVISNAYSELLARLDRAAVEGGDAVIPEYLVEPAQVVLNSILSWTLSLNLERVYMELESVRRGLVIVAALALGGALGVVLRLVRGRR